MCCGNNSFISANRVIFEQPLMSWISCRDLMSGGSNCMWPKLCADMRSCATKKFSSDCERIQMNWSPRPWMCLIGLRKNRKNAAYLGSEQICEMLSLRKEFREAKIVKRLHNS